MRKILSETRIGYPYCSEYHVCSGEPRHVFAGTSVVTLKRDKKTKRLLVKAANLYLWVDDTMLCDEEAAALPFGESSNTAVWGDES